MDCQMPEMDGYEATAEIRRQEGERHTPIIAITASAMAAERDHCLAVGMDDHLPKPVRRDALAAVLHRWVGQDAADVTRQAPEDERVDEELLAELLELMAQSGTGASPVLDAFLSETGNRLDRIHRTLDAGDLAGAGDAAHSLKGAAGAFAARRLASLGADLEQACRRHDGEAAVGLVPQLEFEFDAFRSLLHERYSAVGSVAGEPQISPTSGGSRRR
jgi:two-component system sensor histidine kinase/response regulator